jgi:hypothetical protein
VEHIRIPSGAGDNTLKVNNLNKNFFNTISTFVCGVVYFHIMKKDTNKISHPFNAAFISTEYTTYTII